MAKLKCYANYGVLRHEMKTIFTVSNPECSATYSEEVEVTLPDGWTVDESIAGAQLLNAPDGTVYIASRAISSRGSEPILCWDDGTTPHTTTLEWVKI